ncbi:hypothetical protein KJ780_03640, partial [Candidatus Micrarchaeota archaeon]|nr:hypothetical protein [Candidatus Micrarchaeota archaeon]
ILAIGYAWENQFGFDSWFDLPSIYRKVDGELKAKIIWLAQIALSEEYKMREGIIPMGADLEGVNWVEEGPEFDSNGWLSKENVDELREVFLGAMKNAREKKVKKAVESAIEKFIVITNADNAERAIEYMFGSED